MLRFKLSIRVCGLGKIMEDRGGLTRRIVAMLVLFPSRKPAGNHNRLDPGDCPGSTVIAPGWQTAVVTRMLDDGLDLLRAPRDGDASL